jgi:hypothetical protein
MPKVHFLGPWLVCAPGIATPRTLERVAPARWFVSLARQPWLLGNYNARGPGCPVIPREAMRVHQKSDGTGRPSVLSEKKATRFEGCGSSLHMASILRSP